MAEAFWLGLQEHFCRFRQKEELTSLALRCLPSSNYIYPGQGVEREHRNFVARLEVHLQGIDGWSLEHDMNRTTWKGVSWQRVFAGWNGRHIYRSRGVMEIEKEMRTSYHSQSVTSLVLKTVLKVFSEWDNGKAWKTLWKHPGNNWCRASPFE